MIKDNIKKIYDSIDDLKSKLNINYDVKLMAVTKTFPVNDILESMDAGQKLFGENRVNEAYAKYTDENLKNKDFSLHMIGHLQRNKVDKAVEIADMIQSIDKIDTLDVVEKICIEKNKKIDYLIEINTSNEPQKYGILSENIFTLLDTIIKRSYKKCNLRGLMTVGPFTNEDNIIRNSFKELYKIYMNIKKNINKDDFDIVSMGMSNDYKIAIEEGSNLIRIGSLIYGNRY